MRALVEASGKMEKCEVTWTAKPPMATVVVKRGGRKDAVHSFGFDDAKAAGLADGQMYQKYPKRMYVARAVSFALRDEFADVLRGIMGAEEMDEEGEIINEDEDFSNVKVESSPTESVNDLLESVEVETSDSIRLGFRSLRWNTAKQITMLKQYSGREGELLDSMREERENKQGVSNGG
mgnify:CR=1 FL=1